MPQFEIVLGPPGTGKTTTLLDVVDEELARGVPPDRIGYFSFTRKAAREAAMRASEKFNLSGSQLRYFRTLHSLCFQTLGMSHGDVFERRKVQEFGDWIGVRLTGITYMDEGSTFGYQPGDRALFMENLARVRGRPLREQYDENSDDLSWLLVDRIARGMEQFKKTNGLHDYTDMLQMFVDHVEPPYLEVLIGDEQQDMSWLQWQVFQKLARRARRVVIAGDDDQAIYKWAGADVDFFVDLKGKVRVLGQSWRVPRAVQEVSADVIRRVKHRRPKEWLPRQEEGEVLRLGRFWEADLWGKDVLVLVRNAYVARDIVEPVLKQEGIIYDWKGTQSVKNSTLEAILAWENLRKGEAAHIADVTRVYELMSSGRGVKRGYKTLPGFAPSDEVRMSDLRERGGLMVDMIWHEALDKMPLDEKTYMLRALQKGESLRKKPRVRVSTIHGAKGGQAEHVILLRDMATRTHAEAVNAPEDEARVWYVASTRAQSRLSIVAPRARTAYPL